jgi:tetratricopeptide (TPR) repeat protein
MHRDVHGLPLSTQSAEAAQAFDRTVDSYLKYRADAGEHLKAALTADPGFGLALCLRGYFGMLAYNKAMLPRAAEAERAARTATQTATPRERLHVEALATWVSGDVERTIDIWEQILADHPHDVLAFRLAHFANFWLGRAEEMLGSVERLMPRWSRTLPGWGTMLSCRCFAHEECGDYTVAEAAGRAAIEIDPADLWGTHAVAHVLEMQGRRSEGIAWLKGLERHWNGAANLVHHLWWHRSMYHLELGDFASVLELYDKGFRNLESALTKAQPDLYIDVQNAASMLFRLERHGVDVGKRWEELADKAEGRMGDCLSVFTLPHWMMALAATGRHAAAEQMLAGLRETGRGNDTVSQQVGRIALPICEAALANRRGEHARAVEAMRPVLGTMYRIGGSHAQQDVLEQLFLDSAMKGGLHGDVRLMLERVAGRHPVPPQRRIGYAEAARSVSH